VTAGDGLVLAHWDRGLVWDVADKGDGVGQGDGAGHIGDVSNYVPLGHN